MRDLYPVITPYTTGKLQVSELHTLYYEEVGNPQGKPAVFLHGGPGGGIDPVYRQYFDPQQWRLVLFDQRGCGQSTPHAELRENTTWNLVRDIEALRQHLSIDQWVVFGGSWGSTLALAYSQTHPEACKGLILRGIFMLRNQELQWFYQEGTSNIFPDAWEAYLQTIPPEERHDLINAYYRRLTSNDPAIQLEAAKAWSVWEATTSKLIPDLELQEKCGEDTFATAFARIECHYFVNKGFLDTEDQLLRGCDHIQHLPIVIVQGRYDVVCPVISAWELHQQLPQSELQIIPDAGHSITEPGIRNALIEATDRFAQIP
ncbi:prolyl aminopeptidase [Acaryochloris marina]|uniref:Proline iminopeptidase n=1 Tax=Acaryochloris marina (strain MBIC 11017) TaxID=329726 RepID=B0CE05_ACAM1|nr:prolyl aminopeptidase [Acaryochloris marina]ABW30479.1 proline iminopeptidase [Acaryochloris marina MBIC11017]BDM79287.1 proline iminopeptidase [Acaryochloris marina MBIC10699]